MCVLESVYHGQTKSFRNLIIFINIHLTSVYSIVDAKLTSEVTEDY